jgi:hypothetical protein
MLSDILRSGFKLAHQRPGLIFLDCIWKLAWLVLTALLVIGTVVWVTSDLQAIEWGDTGVPAINGIVAVTILRQFWAANQGQIFALLFLVAATSALLWLLLEAFVRRKIVRDVASDAGVTAAKPYSLKVFLASGLLKGSLLFSSAVLLLMLSAAGARVIAIVTFIAIAFVFTILDTLIRADAVDLLGTDLIRVAGLLGILVSFEGMVAASLLVILLIGVLSVTHAASAASMFVAAVIVAGLLNLMHSYLLLVRFSAVAIMRRNVVEV